MFFHSSLLMIQVVCGFPADGWVFFSDDEAEGVTLSVQVTVFSTKDELALAREIKSLMKLNGFSFEGRNGDDSKPEDGIYMKAQRFSKFYESEE